MKSIHRFDVVARMETFSADSEYIINRYDDALKTYIHSIKVIPIGMNHEAVKLIHNYQVLSGLAYLTD